MITENFFSRCMSAPDFGGIESRELHELRVGAYMRAAYEGEMASRQVSATRANDGASRRQRHADWDARDEWLANHRRGKCLCCGETKQIPPQMHVCMGCFDDMEEGR